MKLSEIADEYKKVDLADFKKHIVMLLARYGYDDVNSCIKSVYHQFHFIENGLNNSENA